MNDGLQIRAMESLCRELDARNKRLELDLQRFHEGVIILYKKVFPQALDAPNGKWFMFDEGYADTIIRGLRERFEKGELQ